MIVPEGWPFVLVPVCAGVASAILGWVWTGWSLVAVGVVCLVVFRDPPRSCELPAGVACAPADGRIDLLQKLDDGPAGRLRVRVRMPPFAPQVTRLPLEATLIEVDRLEAPLEAPREALESSWSTAYGTIALRQIAGRFARRIVFDHSPGRLVERGARVGVMRFGTRVEVDLPIDAMPLVHVGDRVHAGSTAIARWTKPEVA
jgi:phosphatidylserine decarboxylase